MHSMTGFGRGEFVLDGQSFRLEIRSYNNRFIDTKTRLPWINGLIEGRVNAAVKERVSRGRIEVSVHAAAGDSAPHAPGAARLNEALARDLAGVLKQLAEVLGGVDLKTAAGLLPPQRDLITSGMALDDDQIWQALDPALRAALDGLVEMRRKEGVALAADLAAHLEQVAARAAEVRGLAADLPGRLKQKLTDRLAALQLNPATVDPTRVAQEVAHLVDRRDVSEELARIDSHLTQLHQTMSDGQPAGRRIEFLLQELNRELTTIASKSDTAEIAHHVVEAKGELEKMREQALNVE
jgi:uncharacterized protein (TIGR00255 family)